MALALYCSCGAKISVNSTPAMEDMARRIWESAHSGPGHERVTAEQCRAARERSERGTLTQIEPPSETR